MSNYINQYQKAKEYISKTYFQSGEYLTINLEKEVMNIRFELCVKESVIMEIFNRYISKGLLIDLGNKDYKISL